MITPIPWEVVEDAIYDFFVGATNLDVIWVRQSASRPAYPYGTLAFISGPTTIGIDEIRQRQDVEIDVVGQREVTVEFQIFGAPKDLNPTEHARAIVTALSAAFAMPTFLSILQAGGLAIRELQPISLPDQQVGDGWITRAACDVRFGLSSNVSQAIDVIEHVHATAVDPDLGTLPNPLVIDRTFP